MTTKIKYILKHWLYFQYTAIKLNCWKPRFILHDLDKIYLILKYKDTKEASKQHRINSKHHAENKKKDYDFLQMVIDWESARYTKEDKPLTARETLVKYYSDLSNDILPILNKLEI